jgi:hypothetical protein
MKSTRRLPALLGVVAVLLSLAAIQVIQHQKTAPAAPAVNPDAAVLQAFEDRVNKYLEQRKQATKDVPRMKETSDPVKLKATQALLGDAIRTARAHAQPGEILTPEIRNKFRQLLYPEMKGEDGRDAKKSLKDEAPDGVSLKVNAKYPEGEPLPTVPAKLLLSLPPLPEPLTYRIIGKHLILHDTEADIIVDYMLNVIQ